MLWVKSRNWWIIHSSHQFFCILSTAWWTNMVYNIPLPSIFIYWPFSITCSVLFVIELWKFIVKNFISIFQKNIYILLIYCINRSRTCIWLDFNFPTLFIVFTVLKHMWLTTFSVNSNQPLNTVRLLVFPFLMLHESIDIIPYGEYNDLSLVNNDPTERITLVLFWITVINQLVWVEIVKE